MAGKFCPQCGAPLAAGTKFCEGCGAPLQAQEAQPVAAQPAVTYAPPPPAPYAPPPPAPYTASQQPEPAYYAPQPIAAPAPAAAAKKPLYKKWWFWLIAGAALLVVIIIAASGGTNAKQEDLLNYLNQELPRAAGIESQVVSSFEGVTGENYTDDDTMLKALRDEVIPASKRLIEAVEAIVPAEQELRDIHKIYVDAVKLQDVAFAMYVTALEQQDRDIVERANDKLSAGVAGKEDYVAKRLAYATANGVTIS